MRDVAVRGWALGTVLVASTLAWACSGGSSSPTAPDPGAGTTGNSGPQASASATGPLAIHLTDSPFSDAKALLVSFAGVSVHRADGDSWQTVPFASGSSRTCDLKKLNGPVDVLGVGALPVGKYTQVRLLVSAATIYFDNPSAGAICAPAIAAPAGDSATVDIPSGEVKLNREFTLTSAGSTMLLDFDGDQSIRQTGSSNSNGNGNGRGNGQNGSGAGKYMMTPTIRVVSVQ